LRGEESLAHRTTSGGEEEVDEEETEVETRDRDEHNATTTHGDGDGDHSTPYVESSQRVRELTKSPEGCLFPHECFACVRMFDGCR
jgi:hypothetical protein